MARDISLKNATIVIFLFILVTVILFAVYGNEKEKEENKGLTPSGADFTLNKSTYAMQVYEVWKKIGIIKYTRTDYYVNKYLMGTMDEIRFNSLESAKSYYEKSKERYAKDYSIYLKNCSKRTIVLVSLGEGEMNAFYLDSETMSVFAFFYFSKNSYTLANPEWKEIVNGTYCEK